MELRWLYDESVPSYPAPELYAANVYVGGDTPHVWTAEERASRRSPFMLPNFAASNREDTAAAAHMDAGTIHAILTFLGVPHGVTYALDIETRVYGEYLRTLNGELDEWLLMKYGSVSTILQNPRTSGGTWGAHWTDNIETAIQGIESGEFHALQWANATQLGRPYDLSVISSDVPLWHVR